MVDWYCEARAEQAPQPYAYPSGQPHCNTLYVLEALPAGSYSIDVSFNEDWALYYPSATDVSTADETYVTIYSVDLRAP